MLVGRSNMVVQSAAHAASAFQARHYQIAQHNRQRQLQALVLLPRQRQAVQVAASLAPESVEAPNFDEATNPTEAFLAWYRSLPTKAQRELKTRLLYVLIALGGVMVEIRERDAVRLFVALAVFALTLYELRNKLDEISRS